MLVVKDKLVAHEGLFLVVGQCLWQSYSDNGMVGLQYLEWLQVAINELIGFFY